MSGAVAVLFYLEAVVTVIANTATIIIFAKTPRLHRKQYTMIISQAVADLFVGLVSVPMFTARNLYKLYSPLYSRIYYVEDAHFAAVSLFGLATLAVERAHATYRPFRHSTVGTGPYIIGIVLMWTAPSLVTAPMAFNVGGAITRNFKMAYIGFTLVVIAVAYFLIVLKVRYSAPLQAHDANIQENKKLTVTLAVITALSLVMWLPYQCLLLTNTRASKFIYFAVKFLHYGNSLVNSIVYAFRMREIKREIKRVLCCCSNQISPREEREIGNIGRVTNSTNMD